MNPWALYDDLIDDIPRDLAVADFQAGPIWTWLEASDGNAGVAMTIDMRSRPSTFSGPLIGRPLRDAAQLVKSWNLVEAAVGAAAINAWHNRRHDGATESGGAFDTYVDRVRGRNVAVIGHFPHIEDRLGTAGELSIIERNPRRGDYIDTAAEYLLPEQDYVFITGSTVVNKTLPRLLELSRNAHVVLTGPTTPLAPVLFDYGVDTLSGMIIGDAAGLKDALRGVGAAAPKHFGTMVDYARPAKERD